MKSEDGMLFPLLLFNYSLLTQYVLLSFCLKTKEYSHFSPFAFGSINKSYKLD